MTLLKDLYCQAIPAGHAALTSSEIDKFLSQLSKWEISAQNGQLVGTFQFNSYYETIAFVNAVAWIAHKEDHHPDLIVSYNRCTVSYHTHTVQGLSQNDFICAAKVEYLLEQIR